MLFLLGLMDNNHLFVRVSICLFLSIEIPSVVVFPEVRVVCMVSNVINWINSGV